MKLSGWRCLALVLLFFLPLALQAADSEPDWEAVQGELVSLLQELIRADTQNPPGNEIRACRILNRFFRHEGIKSRIYKVDDSRANLLARLKGDGSQQPVLLAAHTDVVPVDASNWSIPPFSGEIQDGFIYGRGAIDDKGRLAVNAMTMALLKRRGVPLRRDIIFLAAAGEETGGLPGVGWMLERHRDKLDAAFALNEGGRIITAEGNSLYIALETEEKIAYNIALTVLGTTGHASVPRLDNAIYAAARALDRLSRYSSPKMLDDVTRAFFSGISGLDPAVRWLDGEVLTEDPLYLALMTNTISPTFIEGGIKSNVHPPQVKINLNCRLLPDQDLKDFIRDLESWIAPGPYKFKTPAEVSAPDPSPQDGLGFLLIEQVCGEMFPGVPVLPYLSPGMSDATRFRREGIPTYGLLPFPLDRDEVKRMHGADERLAVESLMTGMKLTYRLVELAGK